MNVAELVPHLDHPRERPRARAHSLRALAVAALGPLTMLAGVVWAVAQPWRITLLHPHGQSFWWLFSEAPLFVVLAGAAFRLVVAPALLRDLAQAEEEAE